MDADTTAFLDKVVAWVKSQGGAQKDRSGITGWVIGLGIGVIALGVVAFLYWRNARAGEALAALQHAKDVEIEDAKRAAAQAKIETNQHNIDELNAKVTASADIVKSLDARIAAVDTVKAQAINDIDHMQNWKDVDRYLAGGDPPTPTGRAT